MLIYIYIYTSIGITRAYFLYFFRPLSDAVLAGSDFLLELGAVDVVGVLQSYKN